MDALEAIKNRYSVREYTEQTIPNEVLIQLVDAGRRAPSGRNVQPCEFIIVVDRNNREKIAEICEYGKFIARAAACIVVYAADTKYYLEDGCAAVQNILIAATSLGIGSCWIAGDKKPYTDNIDRVLNVPQGNKLIALISLGYAKNNGNPRKKRPVDEVIHWERF